MSSNDTCRKRTFADLHRRWLPESSATSIVYDEVVEKMEKNRLVDSRR